MTAIRTSVEPGAGSGGAAVDGSTEGSAPAVTAMSGRTTAGTGATGIGSVVEGSMMGEWGESVGSMAACAFTPRRFGPNSERMAQQGQPRSVQLLTGIADAHDRVRSFLDTNGKDLAAMAFVRGREFNDVLATTLRSSFEEARAAMVVLSPSINLCDFNLQGERDAVGEFLLQNVDLGVWLLEHPDGPAASPFLSRLFLCDPECNYFLCAYGAVPQVR